MIGYTLTIRNKEDFLWLKSYIQKWQNKAQANVAAYVEYIDMFNRLAADFENAYKDIPKEEKEKPKSPPAPAGHIYCKDHPKYKALRVPRNGCETCLNAYKKLHPNINPQKIRKYDKTAKAT